MGLQWAPSPPPTGSSRWPLLPRQFAFLLRSHRVIIGVLRVVLEVVIVDDMLRAVLLQAVLDESQSAVLVNELGDEFNFLRRLDLVPDNVVELALKSLRRSRPIPKMPKSQALSNLW